MQLTKNGIESSDLDGLSVIQQRIHEFNDIENIIGDKLGKDKIIDIKNTILGYKIITIKRGDSRHDDPYQILLDNENNVILKDVANICTEIMGKNNYFLVVSFYVDSNKYHYIKDIKNNRILKERLDIGNIKEIQHIKEIDGYLVKGERERDKSIIDGFIHAELFDNTGNILDEGGIDMLENNFYAKHIRRRYDHERVADISFNRIEEENGKITINTLFEGVQTPSDYEKHQDNYFFYAGDGIVIEGAPRGGKDVPSPFRIYDGEFGQATDIFDTNKKQSPKYTGKLNCISRDLFSLVPQVFPREGVGISSSNRENKFRAPHMNFTNFDGTIITQKPYCEIKKVGNIFLVKQINQHMIRTAEKMEKTNNSKNTDNKVNKQYITQKDIKDNKERFLLDTNTLNIINENESFLNIKENNGFIECKTNQGEIVIYDINGNRKADNIKGYTDLEGKFIECTTISGEKNYYDNNWNKIEL